jgi:tRNA dimethylallyltransferase
MLAQGLVAEVRSLMQRPDLHADLPSMRCVGYRQAWEMIQKQELESHTHQSLDANLFVKIRALGLPATRQLAKRQLTWLRGLPEREVLACDAPDLGERVLAAVRRHWG